AERVERVEGRIGDEGYRTTVATVASGRPALRDELLTPERDAPVSAVTRGDVNDGFVDEHRLPRCEPRSGSPAQALADFGVIDTKRPSRPLSWKSTTPSTFAKRESSLARPTFRPGLR